MEKLNYNKIVESIKKIDKNISVRQTSKPLLNSELIARDFINKKVIDCFICSSNNNSMMLCSVQFEHHLPYARITSNIKMIDTSLYWIGIVKTKKAYPHSFFRQENLVDKFHNIFSSEDIKFPNAKKFNSKFFVSSENEEKLILSLEPMVLDYLLNFDSICLELKGNTCLFRIDQKSIQEKQAENYIKTGFELEKLLS